MKQISEGLDVRGGSNAGIYGFRRLQGRCCGQQHPLRAVLAPACCRSVLRTLSLHSHCAESQAWE